MMTDHRPTEMDRYLFDLNGFLIIKNALSPAQVAACNETYDEIQNFEGRGWLHGMHVVADGQQDGIMVQQLYEAGGVWEDLIDHPSWFEKVKHFIGTDDPENFDGHLGPMFIDECFGSIREKGDAMRVHSGGQVGTIRTQFRFHAGNFHCGQVNILMAQPWSYLPVINPTFAIPIPYPLNNVAKRVCRPTMLRGQ